MTEYDLELKIRDWFRQLSNRTGNAKLLFSIYFLLLLIAFTYVPWSMQFDNGMISGKFFVKYSFLWGSNNQLWKIDFDRIIIEFCILTALLGLFLTVFWKKGSTIHKSENISLRSQALYKTLSLDSIRLLSKEAPEKMKELYELQDRYKEIKGIAEQKGKDVETFLREHGADEEAIKHYWRVVNVSRLK